MPVNGRYTNMSGETNVTDKGRSVLENHRGSKKLQSNKFRDHGRFIYINN